MTVRLSAMAEEHMKRIIQNWKSASRRQGKLSNYSKYAFFSFLKDIINS